MMLAAQPVFPTSEALCLLAVAMLFFVASAVNGTRFLEWLGWLIVAAVAVNLALFVVMVKQVG